MTNIRAIVYFTVEGRGEFPMDMLHYDRCFPEGRDDTAKMMARHQIDSRDMLKKRQVRLGTCNRSGPTPGRWDSFNWRVVAEG